VTIIYKPEGDAFHAALGYCLNSGAVRTRDDIMAFALARRTSLGCAASIQRNVSNERQLSVRVLDRSSGRCQSRDKVHGNRTIDPNGLSSPYPDIERAPYPSRRLPSSIPLRTSP